MIDQIIYWLATNPRKADALGVLTLIATIVFVGAME